MRREEYTDLLTGLKGILPAAWQAPYFHGPVTLPDPRQRFHFLFLLLPPSFSFSLFLLRGQKLKQSERDFSTSSHKHTCPPADTWVIQVTFSLIVTAQMSLLLAQANSLKYAIDPNPSQSLKALLQQFTAPLLHHQFLSIGSLMRAYNMLLLLSSREASQTHLLFEHCLSQLRLL